MKRISIFLTALASFTVQAQDIKPVPKVLLGYTFSPDYCFRTLANSDGNPSTDLAIKSRNNIEVAKFGYTTGLNVLINFSQTVGFETGLLFSNKGYQTKNQDLVYFPGSPNLPTKAQLTYAYQYIGIPLKVKFSAGKSKTRFISSMGVITSFILTVKQTTKLEYSDGRTAKNSSSSAQGFDKVDISPVISFGIDHQLNNKIHLIAEPSFRYGILRTKDAPVKEHLWNMGLNIGLYCALR